MKKINLFIFSLIFIALNFSCKEKISPVFLILSEEDFADCIDVSDFNSTHAQNYDTKELEAIKQQNFSDVLVSLNGFQLGYWKLPCTIPLLPNYSDRNYVRVIPCVRTPHLTLTTVQYHFVTPIEEFFDMTPGGEYRLSNKKLKYLQSVEFPILETFSQSTLFGPRDSIHPVTIQIVYDNDLKKDIGKISLSGNELFFDIATSYFTLLGRGERQFWEISYKTTNGQMITHLNFESDIVGNYNRDMAVLPSTKGNWKKIYIDIADVVMQVSYTAPQISVRLNITGLKEKENQDAEFYFENIKLITMMAPY